MTDRKFLLLFLEDDEYYFKQIISTLYLSSNQLNLLNSQPLKHSKPTRLKDRTPLKGRLHLASRSISFEPFDPIKPVYRINFRHCSSCRARNFEASTLLVTLSSITLQRPNRPYVHVKLPKPEIKSPPLALTADQLNDDTLAATFQFNAAAITQEILTLYNVSQQSRESDALRTLIAVHEASVAFDATSYVSTKEKRILEIKCIRVSPLTTQPVLMQLTSERFYLQAFHTLDPQNVISIELWKIARMYRRRHVCRQCALEIYLAGSEDEKSERHSYFSEQPSIYLAFKNEETLNQVVELITSQPLYQVSEESSLRTMTYAWVKGEVSNFDYLLYLNQCSGRTFQDINQYPVFPWVISNYHSEKLDLSDPSYFRDLSKPIGALNPERLESCKLRFQSMKDDFVFHVQRGLNGSIDQPKPFLWGSFYSTAAYVLYYLVRQYPQLQLKLQSGTFDLPNRLFHSVESTFNSCLYAPSDFKELVPEFFSWELSQEGSFLTNHLQLDLGFRDGGIPIGDVELPPWSHNSVETFINFNRAALESDYVSQNIHHWIDLIFGHKSRGPAAEAADNVFYYLTTECPDLNSIKDPVERRSVENQVIEFGQAPKQLFFRPHPKRFTKVRIEMLEDDTSDSCYCPSQAITPTSRLSNPSHFSRTTSIGSTSHSPTVDRVSQHSSLNEKYANTQNTLKQTKLNSSIALPVAQPITSPKSPTNSMDYASTPPNQINIPIIDLSGLQIENSQPKISNNDLPELLIFENTPNCN